MCMLARAIGATWALALSGGTASLLAWQRLTTAVQLPLRASPQQLPARRIPIISASGESCKPVQARVARGLEWLS